MTKTIYILLLLCSVLSVLAQREDYVWLGGYNSNLGRTPINGNVYGITKMDFNFNPRSIYYDSLGINFRRAIISYCDTTGHLLFYSNGFQIRNHWDEIVENGDSLNFSKLFYHDSAYYLGGQLGSGGDCIQIPIEGQVGFYMFIYVNVDEHYNCTSVRCSLLDMNSNGGHGKILFKDSLLIEDTIYDGLSACRHGNGKDWWILTPRQKSGSFHRIHLKSDGKVETDFAVCTGIYNDTADIMEGQARFSPDGTKYALLDWAGSGIYLYNFDRCAGLLFNPRYLHIPYLARKAAFLSGPVFSPNSRYLYLTADSFLFQFDTYAPDIWASIDTIAIYDTLNDPDRYESRFCVPQLGPDGKIYISHGLGSNNYDLIDSPNGGGASCKFIRHGLMSASLYGGVPNFQNFRLGRLLGSPCDTLTRLLEIDGRDVGLLVYPNPAQEVMILDYALVDWSKYESLRLSITDLVGHQVYGYELPRFSALHKVNTSDLAQGMYMIDIKDSDGRSICTRKVVKE